LEARVYRISLAPRAERDFRSLASEVQRRLKPRIDALGRNPRPRRAEALKGEEGFLVLKIGHRREVYRRP
jgi:mRNA-degrading endonuclease RelE of RelBE toxin-antitoxin system